MPQSISLKKKMKMSKLTPEISRYVNLGPKISKSAEAAEIGSNFGRKLTYQQNFDRKPALP